MQPSRIEAIRGENGVARTRPAARAPLAPSPSDYDLVTAVESRGRWHFELVDWAELFDADTISALHARLLSAVDVVTGDAERSLGSVELSMTGVRAGHPVAPTDGAVGRVGGRLVGAESARSHTCPRRRRLAARAADRVALVASSAFDVTIQRADPRIWFGCNTVPTPRLVGQRTLAHKIARQLAGNGREWSSWGSSTPGQTSDSRS